MKRFFMALGLITLMISGNANAQGVLRGNVIIDPYYGFPNFGKSLAESAENANSGSKATLSGIGPAGIRVEYMLADRIGFGIDAIYNSSGAKYTDTVNKFNPETNMTETETVNSVEISRRLRIHARFNYHFDISSPALDAYIGVGAGTNNRFFTLTENGIKDPDASISGTLLPFSMRVAAGMRYYFTQNIGFNAEIGLGGPIISAGLSFKF